MARRILGSALIVGFIGGLLGCGDSEPAPSTVFVGEISAPQTAIAVILGAPGGAASGEAAVYVCDGIATSRWFFGTVAGDVLQAEADEGGVVQATVIGDQVTGTVDLPGSGTVAFTATLAIGVAGIYQVNQTATGAEGFSATGAELQADITAAADGAMVSGTVLSHDGTPIPLSGDLAFFGETEGTASWIVQSDGEVRGAAMPNPCRTVTFKLFRSFLYGVECEFLD